MRRLHGQAGGFEFGKRCLEHAIHAAEELNQPPGARRTKAGSQGEGKPENLVGVGFGRGKLWIGGDDGIRQEASLGAIAPGTMPTLSIRENPSQGHMSHPGWYFEWIYSGITQVVPVNSAAIEAIPCYWKKVVHHPEFFTVAEFRFWVVNAN